MTKEITGKWCYSTNEENFTGNCATEAEAHEEAKQQLNNDHEPGSQCTYWIGQTAHPIDKIAGLRQIELLGEYILERIEEDASEEIAANDQIFDMEPDDIKMLGAMVLAFAKEKATAKFFGVSDTKAHTHITE
jgi:hypothetical protein